MEAAGRAQAGATARSHKLAQAGKYEREEKRLGAALVQAPACARRGSANIILADARGWCYVVVNSKRRTDVPGSITTFYLELIPERN